MKFSIIIACVLGLTLTTVESRHEEHINLNKKVSKCPSDAAMKKTHDKIDGDCKKFSDDDDFPASMGSIAPMEPTCDMTPAQRVDQARSAGTVTEYTVTVTIVVITIDIKTFLSIEVKFLQFLQITETDFTIGSFVSAQPSDDGTTMMPKGTTMKPMDTTMKPMDGTTMEMSSTTTLFALWVNITILIEEGESEDDIKAAFETLLAMFRAQFSSMDSIFLDQAFISFTESIFMQAYLEVTVDSSMMKMVWDAFVNIISGSDICKKTLCLTDQVSPNDDTTEQPPTGPKEDNELTISVSGSASDVTKVKLEITQMLMKLEGRGRCKKHHCKYSGLKVWFDSETMMIKISIDVSSFGSSSFEMISSDFEKSFKKTSFGSCKKPAGEEGGKKKHGNNGKHIGQIKNGVGNGDTSGARTKRDDGSEGDQGNQGNGGGSKEKKVKKGKKKKVPTATLR